MATLCTVPGGETILLGDAVCVTGYDGTFSRPTVKRASAANLATSKTVFGIAEANSAGGIVSVRVAGAVAETAITSLGVGASRIVATDINQTAAADQCRLLRVPRPDGSEHVVGTCDENGNLAVQPRASRDASPLTTFNPKSFGCPWNGSDDDTPGWAAMMAAIPVTGGRVDLPPGLGWFAGNVEIDKPIHVVGRGGGNGQKSSGFEVSPGHSVAIRSAATSANATTASNAVIEKVDVWSKILVRGAGFSGSGIGNVFASGVKVRKGDCYIRNTGTKNYAELYNLYMRIVGTAAWTLIGVRRKKFPFDDQTPLKTPGVFEEREYQARGVINDEEVGQPSNIVSVKFAG